MNMNTQNVRTYSFETLSLLTLKIVLTNARRGVPPDVMRRYTSEELALRLIKKIRKPYKKPARFTS
jgi:hypothetical protein